MVTVLSRSSYMTRGQFLRREDLSSVVVIIVQIYYVKYYSGMSKVRFLMQ